MRTPGTPLEKQQYELFCQNVARGMSDSEAYRQAGYSPKSADANAARLRGKESIQVRIRELQQASADDAICDINERRQILSEIARGKVSDYATMGADGAFIELDPKKATAAVESVESLTKYDDNGAGAELIKKFKLRSPVQAIDLLNKMDGAYAPERHSHTHTGGIQIIQTVDAKEAYDNARGESPD